MKKVVVAMSGGVDSSVAAALLKRQGYDCVGVFMQLHESCSSSDATDAKYVANQLNIPFHTLNFQHDFDRIIDYFVREYNAGRTPNPCIRCNKHLKFGKLSRYAQTIDADFIATGHYARTATVNGQTHLLRGLDLSKDQSYVLFGVPREKLPRILLPIGTMEKKDVRAVAKELGLPVFDKPDSQEICFVPDNDYVQLIIRKSPESIKPGELVDATGKMIGTHPGHQHFTIGQRKGLGIAFGYPIYVTAIDAKSNRVTLGQKEELLRKRLIAREVNWLKNDAAGPREPVRVRAKVRYNSKPTTATAVMTGPDELTVILDEAVSAITPGQAVVCYEETTERLIGGAWIDSVNA
ncbi:MAG: tRNA 2-thiouridine(34) synthase MnmA [Phycisphaerales bacterium]|nr:tRNA 2-thiouridine(34) synthase MnmA [Phycisphaerales bacterium]